MLTRLRVKGFKNLMDVDVPLGPFTCIAGANAVGKSNLFDAITFLAALADRPLLDAALAVQSDSRNSGDVRALFRHVGSEYADEMSFEAEMLIPPHGSDDLGQPAKATITFVKYFLALGRRSGGGGAPQGLEIRREELAHIQDAGARLAFPHSAAWRASVATGRRRSAFISTEMGSDPPLVKLHGDMGKAGRARTYPTQNLPRTILQAANAAEAPTALLVRREMASWRLLQLEPSALRAPDPFSAPTRLGTNGGHLPAALARLARAYPRASNPVETSRVYSTIANRLAELVPDIRSVRVDADERRELLSVIVTDLDGTEHDARSLSDGTLRFLALAVLESDPKAQGTLCLEEPENGIHPERIPSMLALLQDLAVDPKAPVGHDNPLRQVIVNTHSPAVVGRVPDDSLVCASIEPTGEPGRRATAASFRWLAGTWRARLRRDRRPLAKGELASYLEPTQARGVRRTRVRRAGARKRGELAGVTPPKSSDAPSFQFGADRS